MDRVRLDRLEGLDGKPALWRFRLWREWCFLHAVIRHRGVSLIMLGALLLIGGSLFVWLEPEKDHTLPRAIYYTFSLIFGEPPEEFPRSTVLRLMFFLVPLIGLSIILEAIVEVGSMIRDRQRGEATWCRIMAASMSDHVVLVGFGRLGFRTFMLLRKLGRRVVVIEANPQNQFLAEVRADGSPFIIGDGRRERILEEANVADAHAVILATSDDLANLEIALDSRKLNPDIRVVMRMFDQNMADKIADGFNIHIAMSQSSLAASTFATAAVEPDIVSSTIVDNQLIVMQRWTCRAGGPLSGKTVAQVTSEMGLGVVERCPAGEDCVQLFPTHDIEIKAGDRLIVQGPFQKLASLKQTYHA